MIARALTTLPEHIQVVPEIAHAALRSDRQSLVAAWSILRACDGGKGVLPGRQARRLIRAGRDVGDRQARRIVQQGAGTFWSIDATGRLWLLSASKVAVHFGVESVSPPHLIPIEDFRGGPAQLRAAFMATIYHVDGDGRPISRRRVEEQTGVPKSTQRRYEHRHGHAEVVAPVHVTLNHIKGDATRRTYADHHPNAGFYVGGRGDLMRRHADIRRATRHQPGSRNVAHHINGKIAKSARGGRPVTQARGQRPPRAFFPASPVTGKSGLAAWQRSRLTLGKRGAEGHVFDPAFDYAVIESVDARGRRRWESATVPHALESGHDSGGSLRREISVASHGDEAAQDSHPHPNPHPRPDPPAQTMSGPNHDPPRKARSHDPTIP